MSKKSSPAVAVEESSYEKQTNDFLAKTGSTLSIEFLKHDKYFDEDKDTRDIYSCTLKRGKKSYTTKFGQSILGSIKGEKPTAYAFLCCLQKNDTGSFENFCGDFGYDTDSRKAEKTYNEVQKQYEALAKMYSEEELALMAEIQ